jgi:calcium/proton exchanger cax
MHASRLLVAVPIARLLDWLEAPPMVTFLASILAILPLVGLMGHATEALAAKLGHTVGGLLNSTLINLPELIIGGVALSKGLTAVVKASLTGAILANLLVSLGIALIVGGRKYGVHAAGLRVLLHRASRLQPGHSRGHARPVVRDVLRAAGHLLRECDCHDLHP